MRKVKNNTVAFIFMLIFSGPVYGEGTVDTLTWTKFREIINRYHPVMARYQLVEAQAKARFRQALGNFEPKLSYNYDQKQFGGSTYYRFSSPEVKIPLWYGIDLKGSYSTAEGFYLNPENTVPGEGLSDIAVSLPLGKGLLMDRRRATLKQAAIFKDASRIEQISLVNNLVMQAGEAYTEWQTNYRISELYVQALSLAEVRFKAVKDGYIGGDRPAIDTIEALTQVQQRLISSQEARLNLQNSLYELSSFLWLPESIPVDPASLAVIPQKQEIQTIDKLNRSILNNPKLRSYDFKLRDLEIERRLKLENIRPSVDLQLGLLNRGTRGFRNLNAGYWQDNNKIGLNITFPLTFTTARAELQESVIKIKDTRIEVSLLQNELELKMKQNTVEFETLQLQLNVLRQSEQAHKRLLEGEETRFTLGESSLFLVNARETKLLEITEKLIDIENKIIKNTLKARWLAGGLAD